jgi:hypothetical protein
MINEGIYRDLSNESYHADSNSISRSAIMEFRKSPFKYWAAYLNPERPSREKDTPAIVMGKAFHTAILEPDKFSDEFMVSPEPVLLKNVGRVSYDAYKENLALCESTSKVIIPWNSYIVLVGMKIALSKHRKAMELIEGAIYESSYFWKDENSGLMIKARPDILHSNIIVDLKTCADASPRAFQNSMAAFGNHIQGAMVREGVRVLENRDIPNVINICIEKEYPYSIGIYIIDEAALDEGYIQFKQVLLDIKECMDKNEWPDYEIQTINLPKWAY